MELELEVTHKSESAARAAAEAEARLNEVRDVNACLGYFCAFLVCFPMRRLCADDGVNQAEGYWLRVQGVFLGGPCPRCVKVYCGVTCEWMYGWGSSMQHADTVSP